MPCRAQFLISLVYRLQTFYLLFFVTSLVLSPVIPHLPSRYVDVRPLHLSCAGESSLFHVTNISLPSFRGRELSSSRSIAGSGSPFPSTSAWRLLSVSSSTSSSDPLASLRNGSHNPIHTCSPLHCPLTIDGAIEARTHQVCNISADINYHTACGTLPQ